MVNTDEEKLIVTVQSLRFNSCTIAIREGFASNHAPLALVS